MKPGTEAIFLLSAGLIGAWMVSVAVATNAHAQSTAGVSHAQKMHAEPVAERDADLRRSEARYVIPSVTLVRQDGKSVNLPAELDDGRAVVLNFIYTSCTTICPMSSQSFEQFQEQLGAARDSVHLVSISIDPEQDTPARLRDYAAQFHAQRGWDHYSGSLSAVLSVERAMNAYRGAKMTHTPLTLMRAAPGKEWIRFDGFARADELMVERRAWESTRAALVAR
ncbi:MAG TPA: SCO family protein [Steroidobacteraceae bacterium]|nr:SCO family protein [Steroidobacteraceae bacterium]